MLIANRIAKGRVTTCKCKLKVNRVENSFKINNWIGIFIRDLSVV